MSAPVLAVRDLSVAYRATPALRGVSLVVAEGEVLGVTGESGSGKTTLATAMMGLLPPDARVTGGRVEVAGTDLFALPAAGRRALRGRTLALVAQDPMQALNPVMTVGAQLRAFTAAEAGSAAAMLGRVGIPDPDRCLARYPHELSGGMRQRVAIAAALLARPRVLIADEPTTALDVTLEAQIIHLLRELRTDFGGAIVVVTHHLGVIAELCDRVAVMYAGEIVEEGGVDEVFHGPRHPYTRALLACDPAAAPSGGGVLPAIGGRPPDLARPPPGCAFAPRCIYATAACEAPPPRRRPAPGRSVLCRQAAP
jgi:oligopeptide/dipeptide ABC transporter ATP-binding protein